MNTDTKERELAGMTWQTVPTMPTDAQIDRAVSFALNVQISGSYNWSMYMRDVYLRMLVAAPAPPSSASPVGDKVVLTAKDRYSELRVDDDEFSPLERLRAFCSLAMNGQDWLDVEPFFDAIIHKEQPESNEAELVEALRGLLDIIVTQVGADYNDKIHSVFMYGKEALSHYETGLD